MIASNCVLRAFNWSGWPAKAFRPSASRITGRSVSEHCGANKLLRLGVGGEAGANRQHGFAVNDGGETAVVEIAHADAACFGCEQRRGHQLRHACGDDRKHVDGRRHRHKAGADAQRRAPCKDGGAGLAQRARDDQGVAEGAFVGVAAAHQGQIAEFAGLEPMQLQIRIVVEQLRRRADLAHDELADAVGAWRNHLAQLRGRQGDRHIGVDRWDRRSPQRLRLDPRACPRRRPEGAAARLWICPCAWSEAAFTSSITWASRPSTGPVRPVPRSASTMRSASARTAARDVPFGFAGHHPQIGASLLPAFEIGRRVAAHRRGFGEKDDPGRQAPLAQPPCHHQAIAAVISLPAKDEHVVGGQIGIGGWPDNRRSPRRRFP